MGKKKAGSNLFETDLRRERTPFIDADHSSWTPDMNGGFGVSKLENLVLTSYSSQLSDQQASAPRMTRVESYRAPPLRLTLETIEEDKPDYVKSDYLLRSKSVPVEKRFVQDSPSRGFNRLPSYRPGQCGYGISMSGSILYQREEFIPKPCRSRLSRIREVLRCGRFRQAFGEIIARMRHTSRRPR